MSKRGLTRRDFVKSVAAVPALTLAASMLQACAPSQPAPAAQPAAPAAPSTAAPAAPSAASKGGATSLRVVIPGTVPTLDYHWTTTTPTMTVGWHMFETLLAPDKDRIPRPQLANKVTPSSDGLTYDFELRKGIKFHNGKEMTSADVIASLNRWGKVAGIGKTLYAAMDGIDAAGDYGLKIRLKRPYASLPATLAHWGQAAAIMPKEVIEAAGTDQVKEFIGTGPYKFVEWKQDQHIKLTRYDGYQPRSEPASFISGKREALIQDLYFVGGLDNAARVSGMEAGDYGFVMLVSPDNYARLQKNPALKFSVVKPYQMRFVFLNTSIPPFDNVKMRQAMQTALNGEQVMQAYGPPEFSRLSPSLMTFGGVWENDGGKEFYNQKNPAKAKQLAQEAGYKGEPLVYMTDQTNSAVYRACVAVTEQLKTAGFNIDLQNMDWATLVTRRGKPEGWNMLTTGFDTPPEPSLLPWMNCTAQWAGRWCNNEVDGLMGEIQKTTDIEARAKLWAKAQELTWKDAYANKLCDEFALHVYTTKLKGYVDSFDCYLWNTSLEA